MDTELLEEEYRRALRLAAERAGGQVAPSVEGFLLFARHLGTYELILPCINGRDLLEVGCNVGYGSRFLAASGFEVTAIDNDGEVLEAARRAGGTGIRFVEADAARMPFEESSFDTVVGLEVLEHLTVDAAEDFVSECARVLRPAGSLIVVTPNRYFRMMPGQRPINPEHTRELTEKQVRALLASRFGEVRTMGTRATDYLEEVEKHRIGRSARRAYIVGPAGRFVRRHAPGLASKLKPPPPEVDLDIFLSDAPRVEAGDFRLEEPAGKRAMEVVAVARKVP